MRCNICKNCLIVNKARQHMLAISTQFQINGQRPGTGHDDGTVAVWNDTVRDYPCLKDN